MSRRYGKRCWYAGVALGVGALVWAGTAGAQLPCPIRVVPPNAQPWEAAAKDAARRPSSGEVTTSDCKSIEIIVLADGGARLEFTTTEGRQADRQLQGPDDLVPAIAALLVTVGQAPETSAAAAAPKIEVRELQPIPALQSVPRASPLRTHFIVGAGAGGRLGLGHKYLAPALSLRASGVLERWELGAFAEWDPLYARLAGASPPGFAMSALVVGALFGRREHAGRVDVSYGVDLAVASVASSADPDPAFASSRSVDASQQRVGIFAGFRYPNDRATHVTVDAMSDAALSGVRAAATSQAGLPPFPRYGVTLCLGVETVAL